MDAYDHAVAYLTERPGEILDAWKNPATHPGGIIFGFVSKNRSYICSGEYCGCLTQVRNGDSAQIDKMTVAIQRDERIPTDEEKITVAHLPVFAEWQRRIDKELGRTPPVWTEPMSVVS